MPFGISSPTSRSFLNSVIEQRQTIDNTKLSIPLRLDPALPLNNPARPVRLLGPRNSGSQAGAQLFRIESERLKLPAPFSRRIAKPLNADAAGQATFDGCFDKIGCEEGE